MKTVAVTAVQVRVKGRNIMNTLSENMLVIHDQNPVTFKVWLISMIAIFILYFLVSTIRDINREKKIEELTRQHEQENNRKKYYKL